MGLKDDIKKEYQEKKTEISEEIAETKADISTSVNKGVKKTKSFFRKVLLGVFGLAILALIGYFLYANWVYSEGTRTGTLVKISHKGYVFKTYEGELNLGGFSTGDDGIVGNIWSFSVKNDAIYKKLQTLEGKQVTLHYKEINQAMPWQGDTNYFIHEVEPVAQ